MKKPSVLKQIFLQPGLTLVSCPKTAAHVQLRIAFHSCLANEDEGLGIGACAKAKIQAIYTGNDREHRTAKQMHKLLADPVSEDRLTIEHLPHRSFNWAQAESRSLLMDAMRSQHNFFTATQEFSGRIDAAIQMGLAEIDRIAAACEKFFILFCNVNAACTLNPLQGFSQDLLVATPCEPDPEFSTAFHVAVAGTAGLGFFGHGESMVQLAVEKKRVKVQAHPFIALSVKDRVIWHMRNDGSSLTNIGKVVSLNKSSVLRRLSSLPPTNLAIANKKWRAIYKEILEESEENS